MYKYQHIQTENIDLVKDFLLELGSGAESFRYFDKRPVETVLKHVLAVVLTDETNKPIAYGHLDREGENLWLGIAVAEKAQGLGLGKKVMEYLIKYAQNKKEKSIALTVDKNNLRAIKLYEHYNFVRVLEKETHYQYQYQVP
ncbi:GNAT family N-acetyltransferase [Spirosoma fluviale]|uniref:Acetyltransferase (GNAT) domain-containing protein n=1 Tax=Spirosoma fluviale TaxID=1597977 RepID=A0A286GIQ5_9BACT|nr:GNAT family N-acetyltransferase [Spirosoma fluviale]SOD95106.1 Acetyltransferase (GNAT) domain-containing protein [Spirosoma fluviale]